MSVVTTASDAELPTDGCPVRVGTHWTQLWVLIMFFGTPLCAAAILAPLTFRYVHSALGSALIVFGGMIAAWVALIVVLARRPHAPHHLHVDEHGVVVGTRPRFGYDDIKSYDSSVYSYGTRGRMYLVLRPRRGSSLIVRPASRERPRFAQLCERLASIAQQRAQAGLGSPAWISFWGSRRAKWMGIGGMALVVLVIVEALVLNPGLVFLAIAPGAVGAHVFAGMIRGKRPFK